MRPPAAAPEPPGKQVSEITLLLVCLVRICHLLSPFRSEIQLTINWIRSHYEEDPQVSLPKHEVYDDYTAYCSINTVKPLSTADFGKVMKQVFPAVRPRR